MYSPRSGTCAEVVYAALQSLGGWVFAGDVVRACAGTKFDRNSIDVTIANGVKRGDILRDGAEKPFLYRIRTGAAEKAPSVAEANAGVAIDAPLVASLGTRCVPANRSQGTIEEALAAILTDTPQSIDEIFVALPIGWSRAEAIAALKEGVLAEWIRCEERGWTLAGEPPEPAYAPVEAPVSHMRERLQEVRCGLGELLRDAVRLQDAPPLIRCIANAYAETDAAIGLLPS